VPLDWSRAGTDWPNRELSRFVATRGHRWHVQRGGTGPRVLLLHGAGASTHSWRGVIPRLLPSCEILAPDLPGQGFSSGAAPRFTLPAMAEDLGKLLESQGFEPEVIVGHSAGAAIGLRMALDGVARPEAVLCLNGALTPFRGVAGVLFPPLARLLALNPLSGAVFARTAATPGTVRSLIAGTGSRIDAAGLGLYERLIGTPSHVTATLAMMARWDLNPLIADLPKLAVPVTLAIGLRDRAVPPEGTRGVAGRLRFGTVREYPEHGHLMHEEAPELFRRADPRDRPAGGGAGVIRG
jgi:magnesium chelatase accessory protein